MIIPVQRPFFGDEELRTIGDVLGTRYLGMGPRVREFESRLAEIIGVKDVIAVNNGTSALHLALDAILDPDDEVIVPSLTYVATVQAVVLAGGIPVFADICGDTLNIDPEDVIRRITPRTRALIPVHFGGQACNMDALQYAVRGSKDKIWIVEDAAHAFGSSYNGKKIGTLGDMTCFSFDPIKNISCGDGGAVVTSSKELADAMRNKRVLGIDYSSGRFEIAGKGYRYHLSDMNAAIGLVQLGRMEDFRKRKMGIVVQYDTAFEPLERKGHVKLIYHTDETFPFFYTIRINHDKRDKFRNFLDGREISTGIHYYPNHFHPFFGSKTRLPVTERVYQELVTLPLYYEMTPDDVERVIAATYAFFGETR